jgi:hypothetical protein
LVAAKPFVLCWSLTSCPNLARYILTENLRVTWEMENANVTIQWKLTDFTVDSMTAKPWRGHLYISFKMCTKNWQFVRAILKFKRLHAIWNEVEVTDLFTSFAHDFWKMQSIVQIHLKKRTSFPWWFRFQLPKFDFCGCYLV